MTTVDWIIVTVVLLLVAGLSVAAFRGRRSAGHFFTGGRRAGPWTTAMFTFGSGTTTDSQSSVMATTWQSGLAGLWWQFIWLPAIPLLWILSPLLRRLRSTTAADFFGMRFGFGTASLYAVYGTGMSIVMLAGILFGSARLVDTITHPLFHDLSARWNLRIPIVDVHGLLQPPGEHPESVVEWRRLGSDELVASLLCAAVIVLGGIGGLRGALWTDILQGLFRIGVSIVMLPLVFRRIGGPGSLHTFEKMKPGILNFVADPGSHVPGEQEPFTPFSLCMLALAAVLGVVVQPQVPMICAAAADERAARWGFTLGSLMKRTMALVWTIIGLACLVWCLGPESPLPHRTDLPPGMLDSLRVVATDDLSHLPEHVRRSELRRERIFADRALGVAMSELLGGFMPGLTGLALAMILAAAVSHGSTQMIAASGMLADHLYRHHLNPGRSQGHYVRMALLFSPLVAGAALMLQTTFTGITDVLRLMIKTPAIIGISFWMGMFWPRWNTAAAWTSTIAGTMVAILCSSRPVDIAQLFPDAEKVLLWHTSSGPVLRDSWQILFIIASALLSGMFAVWISEPQPEMQLEHFYRVLRTRVHPKEQERLEDYQPPVDALLSPAVFFMGLQLPAPTWSRFLEFLLVCILAGSLVVLAKWLVMVL